MQKKLLTMAVAGALAAPLAAFAQVTVYGSIDTGIRSQSKVFTGVGTETGSVLSVEPQGKKSNRLGFKGSDDLGDGLMANFTMEGAFASDTGATPWTTARKTIVGLSKGGNSVDLGRDYTLAFDTHGIWDPMGHDYGTSVTGQGTGVAGTRFDNSIKAKFRFGTGGIGVQYAPGERAGSGSAGTATAFAGDFTFGPVLVGASFTTQKNTAATPVDTKTTNFGAAWTMGAFVFRGGISKEDVDAGNETQQIALGVQYAMSPTLNGRLGYYSNTVDSNAGLELGTAKTFVATLEYTMSKRTLAYLAVDRRTLEGNQITTLDDGATGIGVGISHVF